jgi:apolipoprotein N-acyltransferase
LRGSILPRLKRLVEVSPGAEWLALAAGALLTLAFAPFHIFPLAFVSPALLFLTW